MTHMQQSTPPSAIGSSKLITLLQAIPPGRRGAVLLSAVSFRPAPSVQQSYAVGSIRAAFAEFWETRFGGPIPAERLRTILEPPVPIAFLRDAYDVMDAWGFRFKSCLVWVKDEIGMGKYRRVSHEFLFLGVRGQLRFRNRTIRSWIQARRTTHSRKPGIVRAMVESVSPGPYLELYGREELPDSAWTVYGNQVERRLF